MQKMNEFELYKELWNRTYIEYIMIRVVKRASPSGFGLALAGFGLNGPGQKSPGLNGPGKSRT